MDFGKGKQTRPPGVASSSCGQQLVVYVHVPCNNWHCQYLGIGYGYNQHTYGSARAGAQGTTIKYSSSSTSSCDDSDVVCFGEHDPKSNEKPSDTPTVAEAKKAATPTSLALTCRNRRWHEEEDDDDLSIKDYPKTIIPPPQPKGRLDSQRDDISDTYLDNCLRRCIIQQF